MIDFYDSIKTCSHCKQAIIGTHYFQDTFDDTLTYHQCCLENAGYIKKNGMYVMEVILINNDVEKEEIDETEAIRKQYDDYALMEIIELFRDEIASLTEDKRLLTAKVKYLEERLNV